MKSTHRYLRGISILALILTACAPCFSQTRGSTPVFDRDAVAATLGQWYRAWPQGDSRRPLLLFTTSIGACTPCCASAINHAIGVARSARLDAQTLVMVATPIAREGLAIRKKFKADKVIEDVGGTLSAAFGADPVFPDMYLIAPDGEILLHQHDLQHNQADSAALSRYAPPEDIGSGDVMPVRSSVRLIEDDDIIITDAKSARLGANGVLEFLETRQNLLYRFDARSGRLIAAIPPDTSLAFHCRKPTDDGEFWADLAEHYQPMVKYESIVRSSDSDTTRLIATLFTDYEMGVTDQGQKTLRWRKGPCSITMVGERIVSVDPIPTHDYFLAGTPVISNGDIISLCVWEGFSGGKLSGKALDSSYTFLIIDGRDGRPRPVVPTSLLEKHVGRAQNIGHLGSMCMAGQGSLFYISQSNGLAIRGTRSGDSLLCSFFHPGGLLGAARAFAETTAGYSGGNNDDSAVTDSAFFVSGAASDRGFYTLLISNRAADAGHQIYLGAYDLEGRFIGERPVHTGSDKILAAQIVRCDRDAMVMLTKGGSARWNIAEISLDDVAPSKP